MADSNDIQAAAQDSDLGTVEASQVPVFGDSASPASSESEASPQEQIAAVSGEPQERKHSALPFDSKVRNEYLHIRDVGEEPIAILLNTSDTDPADNCDFILTACNNYYPLVEAIKLSMLALTAGRGARTTAETEAIRVVSALLKQLGVS